MNISIELDVAEAQVAGSRVSDQVSIILGSDEIGFSLCGTKEQLKSIIQEMMNFIDDL